MVVGIFWVMVEGGMYRQEGAEMVVGVMVDGGGSVWDVGGYCAVNGG